MSASAIKTHELVRCFGELRAVDGISIEVPPAKVFGLLGPNGSGKTTTIRLLLGLLRPTFGRAEVLGFDTRSASDRIRESVGVLLEHAGLYDRLTAWENLEFYGRVWRMPAQERAQRSRELLVHFGLRDRRHDRVESWSRGMRQKLGMIRALLHRPRLIFLDEPTAGLDPEAAASLRKDIVDLAAREGTTVFLTTHNLAEAERICDSVAIIRAGRLVASGPTDRITDSIAVPRIIRLKGRGLGREVLKAVQALGHVLTAEVGERGELLVTMREHGDQAMIVRAVIEAGGEVSAVDTPKPSLEDVYLDLMERTDV